MPSYEIERVGDLEEDIVSSYDIALADDTTLAAALRTNNSYLKVIKFRLDPGGTMANFGENQTNFQASEVSIALPTPTLWLTSVKKYAGGRLVLSKWHGSSPNDDGEGEVASNPRLAAFGTHFMLVPPRNGPPPPPGTLTAGQEGYLAVTTHSTSGTQQLRVTAWLAGDQTVEALASATAPERAIESEILAYQTLPGNGALESATVITASISAQKLRLATWRINVQPETNPSVELIAETATDEEITEVSATLFSRQLGDSYLATAIITKDGKLKVIAWRVRSDGTFTRWLDTTAGEASGINIVKVRASDLAVGMRDSENKLRIIYWRFPYANSDGLQVIRMGTATAGAVTGAIKLAHTSSTAAKPGDTIAACRTSAGKLKLIRFRLTPGA